MISIPQKKKEYWDKKIVEILDAIIKEPIESLATELEGVDENSVVIDSKSILSSRDFEVDSNDNIINASYVKEHWRYIIDDDTWKEVDKCINDFYKLEKIKEIISKDNLRDIILSWLFDPKIRESIGFTQKIEDELNSYRKEYIVYFPIPYLEVTTPYRITNDINIGRLPDKNLRNCLSNLRSDVCHPNTVFVYTQLCGEQKFVANKAYDSCSLAVDVMKICYLTFSPNQIEYCLDIDNNISYPSINRCFIQDVSSSDRIFVNEDVNVHVLDLDKNAKQILEDHCINDYSIFIDRIYKQTRTELEEVLTSAIRAYSKALSCKNKYDKIVDLCSILDSLILVNNQDSIKQSLRKYVPLIITDNVENRKTIREHIDKMYDIRSQYIHHRKTDNIITEVDMFHYNVIAFNLITQLVLIANSGKYKRMDEIIKAVDKKLNAAMDSITLRDL